MNARGLAGMIIITLLVSAGLPPPAAARLNTWASHGPEGAVVNALTIDPTNPNVLYIGTNAGVFKSGNGGSTWAATGAPPRIIGLATDATNSSVVYAHTLTVVLKSQTGGGSWSLATAGLPGAPVLRVLAIDPQSSMTLYMGTSGAGVFKTGDGGTRWTNVDPSMDFVEALAIDPTAPTTVYAGSFQGISKTTDGGATWTRVNAGLTDVRIGALAVDPTSPNVVYAGTKGGAVFKSVNGGQSWAAIGPGFPGTLISALVIDPSTPTTLYAATRVVPRQDRGSVFKSVDSGATWMAVNTGLADPNPQVLAIDPAAPTTLYVGMAALFGGPVSSVFKTTTAGAAWTPINTGLTNVPVTALAVDPTTPSLVYAGTFGNGVFKSSNGGAGWTAASAGLTSPVIVALAIDPASPRILYAGAQTVADSPGGVFKSVDGAVSWTAMDVGLPQFPGPGVRALAIDPMTPRTLYVVVDNGGKLFKSMDGAETWAEVPAVGCCVTAFAIDPRTPTTLYAARSVPARFGSDVTFLKSTDAGVTWTPLTVPPSGVPPSGVPRLIIDPTVADTLYAAGFGVSKSVDGGVTWGTANVGLPLDPVATRGGFRVPTQVIELTLDRIAPSTLYAVIPGAAIFKTVDGAANWTPLNAGPVPAPDTSVFPRGPTLPTAVDPFNARVLYAGTQGGVFVLQQATPLVAAVLPSSRSVRVGTPATAFATIINAGAVPAAGVGPALNTALPASFTFQTTDPTTNAVSGTPETTVTLAPGASQSFVLTLTPTAPFGPTDVTFAFEGGDAGVAGDIVSVNTLVMSAAASPTPDIVALAATLGNDGTVSLPGATGAGAFAVATINVGSGAAITASADTGSAALPVAVSICQTVPSTGACLAAPAGSVTTTINASETPTFGVFVAGSATVPFDPANNRIIVRFTDAGGVTRGSTSVAVRTQ